MLMPALYFRPSRHQLRWDGPPAQTWNALRRATSVLLERFRPAALDVVSTQFDEYDQPIWRGQEDGLHVRDQNAMLDSLVDVSSVLAEEPIQARVAVADADADATTLWFVDPDRRQREAQLLPAPDIGPWRTRWFSPDCPLQRGFALRVPVRGQVEARWDQGIFAGNPDPLDWKKLDNDLDAWLSSQLRDLGFRDP